MADWAMIVRLHGPMAFEVAWRLLGHAGDAEDVVQESLVDALVIHGRQPVDNWGGLLRTLVARRAIDRLRHRRREVSIGPVSPQLAAPHSPAPDAALARSELARRLRLAMGQLADREALVFSLHYFGQMTNTQVAIALDLTPDAVGVALHRARERLKQLLASAMTGD